MSDLKLDAEYYNNNSSTQKSLADDILYLHDFKVDEDILDIGCGDGVVSAKLAALAYKGRVLGIDSSIDMIKFSQHHLPQQQFKNLSFANLAAENISFNNQFSLITAFNSLYWIKDLDKTFANIYKALIPDGRLLALIYPLESPYWQVFIDAFKIAKFNPWYKKSICPFWLGIDNYRSLAKVHGFTVLSADTFIESINYPTKQAFKDYVNGWLPCIFSPPENIAVEYLDTVANLAWDRYSNNDGSADLSYCKLHLYLKK